MSEKLIPTEVFESGPDIPASVVVVSATLSTGQRNTSRTQFAGKRLQSKSKRKRGKENSCRCQLPPNPFCPETLHIFGRWMGTDVQAGLTLLTWPGWPGRAASAREFKATCGLITKYCAYLQGASRSLPGERG